MFLWNRPYCYSFLYRAFLLSKITAYEISNLSASQKQKTLIFNMLLFIQKSFVSNILSKIVAAFCINFTVVVSNLFQKHVLPPTRYEWKVDRWLFTRGWVSVELYDTLILCRNFIAQTQSTAGISIYKYKCVMQKLCCNFQMLYQKLWREN